MSQTDKMLARKHGGVGILTFNNPERHNAVSLEMWEATKRILDDFAADSDIRVVVLTGAGGKAFVSGADISKFANERATLDASRAYNVKSDAAYSSIAEFPKPTIAMIQGYCIGGGVGLAVCCDLRICSDNSRFAVPAAKLGLGYGYTGLKRLVDIVGPSFAKEIFYTARQFDAHEALAMGLVKSRGPGRRFRGLRQKYHRHDLRQRAAHHQGGQIYRRRDRQRGVQAQPCPFDRTGRAMFRQPRLHGRPHRVHGKTQTGFYRRLAHAPEKCEPVSRLRVAPAPLCRGA
jgi:enoyl-CoA hydratase/carnithine racemase